VSRKVLLAIGCATALGRWLLRARLPDDYDSFSFLLGMRDDWNLALFQPQFPGYPVYVALGRALIRLGVPAMAAPTLIAAIASGVTVVALARIAEHVGGVRAAYATAALYFVAWLPLFLGGGMLSEPLAAALATSALAALLGGRPLVAGVLAGLLLGTRASYWPLVLSFLFFERRRQFVGLALGILAWAPAFVAKFGAAALWNLGVTHLHGHFETWGNTIVTRPSLGLRVARFARDLFYDGIAPNGWALAAVAMVTLAVFLRKRPALGDWRGWLVLLLPYALWAFFGQNILTQPRHVLPLALGLLVLLGLVLSKQPVAAAVAVAIIAIISLPLARTRHLALPAPAQAAAWAAEKWRTDSDRTAIFAIRSARFFVEQARGFEHPWTVNNRNWLTEIYVDLARLDRFPRHILITDEIDQRSGQPASAPQPRMPGRIVSGPRFCRDERIDRAVPCLQVFELDWAPQ
jgi:hypothetical protein